MKRISIERYKTPTDGYAGCIEGATDDGGSWIMYLDTQGRPEVFWPERDEDGGVRGIGVPLTPEAIERQSQIRRDKMRNILREPSAEHVVKRLKEALEAADRLEAGDVPNGHDKFLEVVSRRIFGRDISRPQAVKKAVSPFYDTKFAEGT